MESKVVIIRADGSAQIGMGHLMRCMSVGIALQGLGVKVYFLTSSEACLKLVKEKGFLGILLSRPYACMEEEAKETLSVASKLQAGLILVDSYRATVPYLEKIYQSIPVFYMDDLGRMDLPVNGLINYNIYGPDMGYESFYPKENRLLLGSTYAPVKPEFSAVLRARRRVPERIMVTMGGSDSLNIAGQLGERLALSLHEQVEILLICGRFSPHLEVVKALCMKYPQIHVLTDVPDMWNYMADSDLVITAAGSTIYELCTLGVPAVCCYYVENQRRIAEGISDKTSMINAGDFSKAPEQVLDTMIRAAEDLLQDFEKREQLSREMRQISDGLGAKRLAEALLGYME